MRQTFDPLPFVFVISGIVPESPALYAYRCLELCRSYTERAAAAVSPEAHSTFLCQWPTQLDEILLRSTREWCAALRAGFKGYRFLN